MLFPGQKKENDDDFKTVLKKMFLKIKNFMYHDVVEKAYKCEKKI